MQQDFSTSPSEPQVSEIPVYMKGEFHCYTYVDAEDVDRLSQWKWRVTPADPYPYRSGKCGEPTKVHIHAEIMQPPKGKQVHHKNGDKLDNRKSNLEVLTWEEHQKRHTLEDIDRYPPGYWEGIVREYVEEQKIMFPDPPHREKKERLGIRLPVYRSPRGGVVEGARKKHWPGS